MAFLNSHEKKPKPHFESKIFIPVKIYAFKSLFLEVTKFLQQVQSSTYFHIEYHLIEISATDKKS